MLPDVCEAPSAAAAHVMMTSLRMTVLGIDKSDSESILCRSLGSKDGELEMVHALCRKMVPSLALQWLSL